MADPTHLTPEGAYEQLKANTVQAIQSYFPFNGRHQTLQLENLHVDDKFAVDDIASQAEAKDKETTWGALIRGDVKLIDKHTGQVVDTKKSAIIGRLPKLTNRYSYIVNGNEYQVDHLFRLKSGVYARVQDNGDLESEFNLKKSPTGRGFSVKLEAKNRKFHLKYGEAHIALYPILKTLGVPDDVIEQSWGKELFAANKPKTVEKFQAELAKFYKKTSDEGTAEGRSLEELQRHVVDFFGQTELRPDTTKLTLGKPYDTVNGEVLFAAAHKTLGISKGTHKPDDRDSLAFKEVASVEDFIPEKIQRGAWSIKARLRQTVDSKKTVGEILSTDIFNRPIHDFFTKGGSVAERSDQTNPIQMISAHRKTTLMSKDFGGIKSDNSLTNEMRSVNQSHVGFLDPMHTPESERTGITLHLAANVRKNGTDLETYAYDLGQKTGRWVNVVDFHGAAVALPDQVTWKGGKPVPVGPRVKMKLPGGEIEVRPWSEAQLVLPSAKGMFNYSSNLIPFLPANNGNRIMMADKQMEQAISLKHREAPLVQTKTEAPDLTFEKFVGHFAVARAPITGTVMAITGDKIDLKDVDGKKHIVHLYNHFPLNDEKGMMHSTPLVKVGDKVTKGQELADSNYTKAGTLAIGTNLRIGYLPYKGYNFEDGIVISESAADKLTSEHLYKKNLELEPDRDFVSKEKFKAWSVTRAAQMDPRHFDALDEGGVIKPGSRVSHGQVLVAAVGKNDLKKQSFLAAYGKKRAFQPYKDKSLVWDEDHEGIVTKVVRDQGGHGIKIYVKTEEPAVIGDKLSGRHGNKGIITKIVKDEHMPFTLDAKTGERRPIHVLLNPSGIPTRINPSQMLETAAAKIAEHTGQPYVVNNFDGPASDYRTQIAKELVKHGLSDEELVYDPSDVRKPLGSVMVGPQYLLKLKHQVEKKLTARGGGTDIHGKPLPDDIDKQPVKGGEHGGQGFGALEMYSLLGHNARHNVREMATYKSDHQDMLFWNLIQTGHEPPPPQVPFAYNKFMGLLKGLGVNVVKEGTTIRLQPMSNREVYAVAGGARGELKDASKAALRSKDLKPTPGGLFDPYVTGGLDGDKWSYIRLAEPVPNPIFCGQANKPGPVPVLLGLKMKELEEVMHGKRTLNGLTGGKAIEHALKKIDVNGEIEALRRELPRLRAAELDRANKKLKYLLPLRELKLKPHEAYVMNFVPVIPPKFRPATPTPTGDVNYAPLNGHYRNLALINDQLKDFDPKVFDESHRQPLQVQLWDAMKALQSVGNYKPVYDVDTSGNRELKGILNLVGGDQPKEGYFQAKLVKRRQNLSIRSTIVPEPALGLDEVGIPRSAAMEMYKPYVVSQLHKWGFDPLRAQDEIKKGDSDLARRALEKVVEDRPILLKRDPALHKFSVMAFKPKLVEGKAIQIHPLVTGGYNADFDGDTMAGTVPMSHEAVEEAKKLFPSNNLFSPTSYGVMYLPGHEALLGLHLLSKWGKETGKKFGSVDALEKAVEKGELHVHDVVQVAGFKKPTTLGRILIESRLPRGFGVSAELLHDPKYEITKKTMKAIDQLKDLGNEWSFKLGFSFGLKDLATLPERDALLATYQKRADHLTETVKDPEERKKQLISLWSEVIPKLEEAQKGLSKKGNRLATMVLSGARGDESQLRQMVAAPMLVEDSTGKTIPYPIKKSFSEGLDVGDFWMYQHGARKGILQKNRGTAEPGAITKDIINASMSTLIVSPDCKTTQGVVLDVKDPDIHDRFTATPYKLKDGTHIPAGTLLDPELLSRLKNSKLEKVLVRSPLKCSHGQGICAKCFGLNEAGRPHDIGTNIGILASQAMGEPSTQLSMKAFHTGGVAGTSEGKSIDAITRFRNLLEMPKKLRDEATVSGISGRITEVKKDPAGGMDVFVEGVRHYVPRHLVRPDIKPGLEVKKGETLSTGYVNPHRLLEATKDIHTVQNYLTNELHGGLFGGLGVRRRNVEVAVRSITNLAKVRDPGHSDWIHGDIVPRTVLDEHNRSLPKGKEPVLYESVLKGTGEIPHLITQDWLQRLNYQQLHTTVQGAASQAQKSDIHSVNPIPALVHGAEFGRPPAGRPSHVY